MFPKCKANEQRRKKACLRLKHHSPRSIVLLHVQVSAAITAFITLNGPCAGDISWVSAPEKQNCMLIILVQTQITLQNLPFCLHQLFPVQTNGVLSELAPTKAWLRLFFLLLSMNTSLLPFARSKIYNRSLWRTRDPFDESVHYKNLSTCIKVLVHEMNKGNNPRKKRTASANATWKERLQKLSI